MTRPKLNRAYCQVGVHKIRYLSAREVNEFVAAVSAACERSKRLEHSTWQKYRRFMIHNLGERRELEHSA
jgi:hypothetical protein